MINFDPVFSWLRNNEVIKFFVEVSARFLAVIESNHQKHNLSVCSMWITVQLLPRMLNRGDEFAFEFFG